MVNPTIPIILASASPWRKQLLEQAGYSFKVVAADIDESQLMSKNMSPAEFAKKAAFAKAQKIAESHPKFLVIGADTVADFNGEIIGKPANEKDAEKIIRKLFGAPHKVTTGIAIVRINDGVKIIDSDTTQVYPKKLTDRQIADHIKSLTWREKAGAYAIEGKNDEFIERIDGSITNVMGMPMELLQRLMDDIIR